MAAAVAVLQAITSAFTGYSVVSFSAAASVRALI
jgi:hypothetical protein